MEAETRWRYLSAQVAAVAAVLLLVTVTNAANFRTQNFLIQAPDT